MKYRLRTLLIVAATVPPLLAFAWLEREITAFSIAAVAPIFLIVKWRFWGVLWSVIFGWGVVYLASTFISYRDPIDPVFAGLWSVLGPVFMLSWCLPIYGAVCLYGAWKRSREPAP